MGDQQVVPRVRSVVDIVTISPAPNGRGSNAMSAGQLAIRDAGRRILNLSKDLRFLRRLFMQLDAHESATG